MGALTKLSLFFKEICAIELCASIMENAKLSIVETLCKLEKIFLPTFFDMMEHLIMHLPYEAKVGRYVQIFPILLLCNLIQNCKQDALKFLEMMIILQPTIVFVMIHRFHTKESGQNKATINSGVCVRGNIYGENDLDYYGIIEEILEFNVDVRFGLVDVNPKSKLHSYEPFVLASQAQQVYYTMYPQKRGRARGEWWATCKVRRKLFIAKTINDEHDDGSLGTHNVIPEDEVVFLLDTNTPMEEDKYKFMSYFDCNMARTVWERICMDHFLGCLKNERKIALKWVSSKKLADTKGHGPPGIKSEVWDGLVDIWLTPEWEKKSNANRSNRAVVLDSMLHTRGLISFAEHKRSMAKLKHLISYRYVYDHVYKNKYVSQHSKNETSLLKESCNIVMLEKYEVLGLKKRQVFGTSSSEVISHRSFSHFNSYN
ncbi:hypothetical protein CR513_18282, partial [Mucuna pruriens]